MPKIHIPNAYRQYTDDMAVHESNATTLPSLFEELTHIYPQLVGTVFSTDNSPFPFVRIVVQENLVLIDEYRGKKLTADATVLLVNAIAGG